MSVATGDTTAKRLWGSGDEVTSWKDIARVINEVNRKNAFEDPTWENLPVKLMYIITELDEIWGAVFREEGTVPEEFADTTIRLLSILHALWGDDWHLREVRGDWSAHRYYGMVLEQKLWPVIRHLSGAAEAWRYGEKLQQDVKAHIELALRELRALAHLFGIALFSAVVVKTQANAGRGKWHGKATGAA